MEAISDGYAECDGCVEDILWYAQPAEKWSQALPLGNGSMGAMVFGGIERSMYMLDEESIWSGQPFAHSRKDAYKHFRAVRRLLLAGQYDQARLLAQRCLTGQSDGYGSHMPAGRLVLDFGHGDGDVTEYRRQLDMRRGVCAVSYCQQDSVYRQESFISCPDKVMVIRLVTDGRESMRMRGQLLSDRDEVALHHIGNTLVLTGRCDNGGVRFAIGAGVLSSCRHEQIFGDEYGCVCGDELAIVVCMASSYRHDDPVEAVMTTLHDVSVRDYGHLLCRHVTGHERMYGRVSLSLSGSDNEDVPTDVRLERVRRGGVDMGLVTKFFNFGRYLLLSSSRPGCLAAHLQGVWNDDVAMHAWNCDYHLDINTQMNYWPVESCNLSECHGPLFDLIESLVEPGRSTTKEYYDCPGWVAHVFTDLWGYTAPGWDERWGFHVTGGA